MSDNLPKFRKSLSSFACFSLIFLSNNSELYAKFFVNEDQGSHKKIFETKNRNIKNNFKSALKIFAENDPLIANRGENVGEDNVLISEIIIEGWENHPEGRKLELKAYDAMSIKPGNIINNRTLKKDLNSIYASGWFSGVQVKSEDGPLGVRLIIKVVPNPILKRVELNPKETIIPKKLVDDFFKTSYGSTLNLNNLQKRINLIKQWYEDKGYSLARVTGPDRISEAGLVSLNVLEGKVSKIEPRFIGKDGELLVTKDGKPRRGKTKDWVIFRELKTKPGAVFNRKVLEEDIKRLYALQLFDDVRISLGPDSQNPSQVIITLDLSEQRTGSLTGGIGYSNAQGIFAQVGLQESNTLGRSWSTNIGLNFGEYSTTYNFSIFDPWIKGDKYRTSFRTNVFLSRDYPQEFRSEKNGRLYAVDNQVSSTTDTFSSIVLEKTGGGFSFSRPLNGGDPFKKSKWRLSSGMNFKKVRMIDNGGNIKPYGTINPTTANISEIICIGYSPSDGSCPNENTLVSVQGIASKNNLNNSVNPTSGYKFLVGTEQFISVGNSSPTFNRMRTSYAFFVPVKLINLTKECRSKDSSSSDCPQTIGFEFKAGSIFGDLPPYEAFCLGGSSSVRGWAACDLAVGKSFVEGSAEYRFPVWRMLSGALFADIGSALGSQSDVPGKPGELLKKSGSGYSLGAGIGVKTPIGPLRLDVASQDLSGDMRYTLGVGWKF